MGSLVAELLAAIIAAAVIAVALVLKASKDFSQAGPRIAQEIRRHYRWYAIYAVMRLGFWAWLIALYMAVVGILIYASAVILVGSAVTLGGATVAGVLGIGLITFYQFANRLLVMPSSIGVSSHYRMSRFYGLWRVLTPQRMRGLKWLFFGGVSILVAAAIAHAFTSQATAYGWQLAATGIVVAGVQLWAVWETEPEPVAAMANPGQKMNVLMVGCDTLRADRLGSTGYPRNLTPFIDSLCGRGTFFSNCYIPIARTAPSLVSYLTGVWPHRHGVHDNFVPDQDAALGCKTLPRILAQAGYHTEAISDWAGSDLAKLQFGFNRVDTPADQWNLKFLIRQGPKDLRLFLSLFTHNRFGKIFLPEIYYLAGIPLTDRLGRQARAAIRRATKEEKPFFLNVFMAGGHPPFGSKYPYYLMYTDPAYWGESKFLMSKLSSPEEIIRSQREPKEAFDLDQIIGLYDGCIKSFDDEVERILGYLRDCGAEENTIVVVYSDHGMEFFEHDTWGQGNSALGGFSARVPLVVVDPRKPGNGHVEHVVRTVDLAPTLVELLDLPASIDMDGVSLSTTLRDGRYDPALTAYFETGIWLSRPPGMHPDHLMYPDVLELLDVPDKASGTLAIKAKYQGIVLEARDRMVRQGRWILVRVPLHSGPRFMLFDQETDPDCKHDVSRQHPDVVARLSRLLTEWVEGATGIDTAANWTASLNE